MAGGPRRVAQHCRRGRPGPGGRVAQRPAGPCRSLPRSLPRPGGRFPSRRSRVSCRFRGTRPHCSANARAGLGTAGARLGGVAAGGCRAGGCHPSSSAGQTCHGPSSARPPCVGRRRGLGGRLQPRPPPSHASSQTPRASSAHGGRTSGLTPGSITLCSTDQGPSSPAPCIPSSSCEGLPAPIEP